MVIASPMQSLLQEGTAHFGLRLTAAQLAGFEQYSRELIVWNQKVNLTRITTPDEIAVKHFLDSLSVQLALGDFPASFSVIDVGTGAGFPGLPLKIVRPGLRLALLESTGKKAAFLQHVVDRLSLTGVRVVTARAEDAGQEAEHREQYDVAVARAVSPLPVLVEYTLPLVKVGGLVIAQKGQNPAAEVNDAARALRILGGKIRQVMPVTVPGLEKVARHLVVIQKIKPTPKQYPRRPGLPAKKPL